MRQEDKINGGTKFYTGDSGGVIRGPEYKKDDKVMFIYKGKQLVGTIVEDLGKVKSWGKKHCFLIQADNKEPVQIPIGEILAHA